MRLTPQRIQATAYRVMSTFGALITLAAAVIFYAPQSANAAADSGKPTIVLVHGAFAESSSWEGVVARLLAKGFPVVAVANPLRGVRSDANYVAKVVDNIPGPVVLVGHSYGGNVITNAATGRGNVKALVYVAGFAPDTGETAVGLSGKYPGSTLGPTLAAPVVLTDGNKDLYIQQAKFREQFAADVSVKQAQVMAATQRPITEAALNEPSGEPAWKSIPSWFIWGSRDKNIPPAIQPYLAQRAGAKRAVEIEGASHVVMTSHPEEVTKLIVEAADATSH